VPPPVPATGCAAARAVLGWPPSTRATLPTAVASSTPCPGWTVRPSLATRQRPTRSRESPRPPDVAKAIGQSRPAMYGLDPIRPAS
jgi:hypothetical protein